MNLDLFTVSNLCPLISGRLLEDEMIAAGIYCGECCSCGCSGGRSSS